MDDKVIIVEGSSDKKRIMELLATPVSIICTNGTISVTRLDELLAPFEGVDIYVFLDADEPGNKTRKLFKQLYPEAHHLYTETMYREVATTPMKVLAWILMKAHFEVKAEYMN